MSKTKTGNLEILLNESLESYYWIGFLLADGHFSERRLRIHLAEKDHEHLLKFGKFINYSGSIKYGVTIMDTKVITQIRAKFGIVNRKTYYPSNISNINDNDKMLSLIIGFIDGDGCIKKQTGRNDCCLTIKLHSSWLNNLIIIEKFISTFSNQNTNTSKINNAGFAIVNFTNSITLRKLKNFVINKQLPVLLRKWNLIDLNFKSRQETAIERIEIVKNLLNQKIKKSKIAQIIGVTPGAITMIIQRNNL